MSRSTRMIQFFKRIGAAVVRISSPRPHRFSARMWRRRQISAIVLLFLLGMVSGGYWFFTGDERVRQQVITSLVHITGGEVELDQASLDIFREIRIESLRVYVPGRAHTEENLVFTAKDVLMEHEPWSILFRRLRVKTIRAWEARLKIWYDRDENRTNLQMLNIETDSGKGRPNPKIYLRNGTVEYQEITQGQLSPVVRQKISGTILPDPTSDHIYRFELTSADEGVLKRSTISGLYDFQLRRPIQTSGNFFLELIDVSSLPKRVSDWQRLYEISQPAGEITTESHYDPKTGHEVHLTLRNGRLRLPLPNSPIPLQEVNADIICLPNHIEIQHLTGRYQNFCQFDGHGTIDGYDLDSPFDIHLGIVGLPIPKDYWSRIQELQTQTSSQTTQDAGNNDAAASATELFAPLAKLIDMLPDSVRQLIQNYSPTGIIDAQLSLRRGPGRETQTTYSGTLIGRDVGFVFREFPYPMQGVQGSIQFDQDNVIIGPLTCRQGDQEIKVSGFWKQESGDHQYNVQIFGNATPLDNALYQALPVDYRQIWDELNPAGTVHVFYEINKAAGKNRQDQMEIQLADVRTTYRAFPVAISDMRGKVTWRDGLASFQVDQAHAARGDVTLSGSLTHLEQSRPQFACSIGFNSLRMNDDLIRQLPGTLQNQLRRTGLQGVISGEAKLWLLPDTTPATKEKSPDPNSLPGDLKYAIKADLINGRIKPDTIQYELTDVAAKGELTNDNLTIETLDGSNGASRIHLAGRIVAENNFSIRVEAKPLELNDALRQALTGRQIGFWETFQPRGQANMSLTISKKTDQPQSDYKAIIDPLGCELSFADRNFSLGSTTGRLIIEPGCTTVEQLTIRRDPTEITVHGNLRENAQQHDYHLNLQTKSLLCNETLFKSLPEPVQNINHHLGMAGTLDANLEIGYLQESDQPGRWKIQGEIQMRNGVIQRPVLTENIIGSIQGQAFYNGQDKHFVLSAMGNCSQLRVKNRTLKDLTSQIEFDGAGNVLTIREISGGLCGGRLAGEVQTFLTGESPGYKLDLKFHDVQLDELIEEENVKSANHRNLRGLFDGRFSMTQPGDIQSRHGEFSFKITDAVLGTLPITAQLLHVFNLSLPREGAFNEAVIIGNIAGAQTQFETLVLRGSAVSLNGAGVMNEPDNELNLVFVTASPHELPDLPVVSSFIKAVSPELMQVRVTGTFDQPLVAPVALPGLDDAIRQRDERGDKKSTPLPPPTTNEK